MPVSLHPFLRLQIIEITGVDVEAVTNDAGTLSNQILLLIDYQCSANRKRGVFCRLAVIDL